MTNKFAVTTLPYYISSTITNNYYKPSFIKYILRVFVMNKTLMKILII